MSELEQLRRLPSWDWPADAAARIKRGLDSAEVAERTMATELAGDLVVMDDEMAAKLLSIVRGADADELRGTAAIALGPALEEAFEVGFDDELDETFDGRVLSEPRVVEIQTVLQALSEDASAPKQVRRMCLEASVRAPQPWHDGAVRAAAAHDDPEWKLTAVFCMGRIEGFESDILAALESTDVDLLVEAVRSAGLAELSAAGPRVLRLAAGEDQDPRVRHAAAEALSTLETEGSAEVLVSLTESEDATLAELAFEALEERRVFSEPPDSGY